MQTAKTDLNSKQEMQDDEGGAATRSWSSCCHARRRARLRLEPIPTPDVHGRCVLHDAAIASLDEESSPDDLVVREKGQTNIMSNNHEQLRVAVLDDYQNVALSMADWSALKGRAAVTVFNDHIADVDAVVSRLLPFDIVCVMRERTPMTRAVIERLPKLRLIASTVTRNPSIDVKAAEERGVQVVHTGYSSAPTIELTWALILAGARHLVDENASLRGGGWQRSIGEDLGGRTLGLLGLGNIGSAVLGASLMVAKKPIAIDLRALCALSPNYLNDFSPQNTGVPGRRPLRLRL
jgi:hypothetical protein